MGESEPATISTPASSDAILSSSTADLQENLLEVHELPPAEDPNATAAAAASLEHEGWKKIHVANIIAYLCNVVLVQLFAFGKVQDLPDNAELSQKYMTLVTPAGWSFSIWPLIFLSQFLFIVAQCTPRCRNSPLVHHGGGVGYWYTFVCLFQICWSVAFAYERLWLSFIFMVHILVCLLSIVRAQYLTLRTRSPASTSADHGNDVLSQRLEYWLLKFPFDLHAGWIIAATMVNFNVALVGSGATVGGQVTVAVLSLVLLLPVPYVSLYKFRKPPNYAIAGVFVWATAAIFSNLNDPDNKSIYAKFTANTVTAIRGLALFACVFGVMLFIPKIRARFGSGGRSEGGVEGGDSGEGGADEEEATRGLID